MEHNENQLDLQVMVIDLHAKNQVNIYKHLDKRAKMALKRSPE